MNTNLPAEQEKEKQMVELLPCVNLPVEKTMYMSSRTPLHYFKLNHLVWGSRNLLQCVTKPKLGSTKLSPVSKPCIKAKRCKRQSFSRVLEVEQERRVRRREAVFSFSFSLRNEVIEQDFIRLTGSLPQRKIKVKKVYKDEHKKVFIDYPQFLKEIVPGNWLSEIYDIPQVGGT